MILSYLRLRPVFGAYLIADIHTESESKFLACIPHWYPWRVHVDYSYMVTFLTSRVSCGVVY